jgi:hypothetical protein
MPLGFLNLDDNIWFQYVSFTIFGAIFGTALPTTNHALLPRH